MRRLIGLFVLCLALPLALLAGLGAGGGGSDYEVRAIFDDVAGAVPGEDVKVAGARVGVIESMDATADKKAAVTLRIDDERFTPFRRDAHCTVRPQSLIGEKFVECQPGTSGRAPLARIAAGLGKGEHRLPLRNTSSPVDLDLIADIMRLPYRQRFAIILNELGTGVAGRGRDLNEVIRRADPALRETSEVLKIVARERRVLARLVRDSDTVLAPLARERRHVADFVVQANRTAQATAHQTGDIEASVALLPAALRELRPYLVDLGRLAERGTPVVRDVGAAAPDLSSLTEQLGPFSREALPALRSAGDTADVGRPVVIDARPFVKDLRDFAGDARPVSEDLDDLTTSLDRTGAINRIMDYFFFQATAINGFDSASHYLRAGLNVNVACSLYAVQPVKGCGANFTQPRSATRRAPKAQLARAVSTRGTVPATGTVLNTLLGRVEPAADRMRRQSLARVRREARRGSAVTDPLLEYLLGGDR
jgi:ABC-type transporter Mla subunit MlaD